MDTTIAIITAVTQGDTLLVMYHVIHMLTTGIQDDILIIIYLVIDMLVANVDITNIRDTATIIHLIELIIEKINYRQEGEEPNQFGFTIFIDDHGACPRIEI